MAAEPIGLRPREREGLEASDDFSPAELAARPGPQLGDEGFFDLENTPAMPSAALGLEAEVDLRVGTLSKALGCLGGYVATSHALAELLLNRARPFVFSTSLPAALCAAAEAAVDVVEGDVPLRERLWALRAVALVRSGRQAEALEVLREVRTVLDEELGIEPARFHSSDDRKEIELRAVWPDAETARRDTEILGELVALVRDQKLRVLVSGFYPYGFVQDAFDDLEKRHSRGKIVLEGF